MTRARIEHWDDIRYSAEFKFFNDDPKSAVIEFRVWATSPQPDGSRGTFVSGEWFDDPSDAEPEYTGSIKWDGCANIDFCANGIAHFCSRESIHRFNVMTNRVYRTAGKMLSESPSGFLEDCR